MKVKIGTRSSKLALSQTESIKEILEKEGYEVEIIKISTKGDRVIDRTIDKVSGNGVFTREIEIKLLEKEIDLAVHSLKDLPSKLPQGLCLAKPPKAYGVEDVYVGKDKVHKIKDLYNKKIATSSIRRKYLLNEYIKNVEICTIRGNIDTRLKKVREDAIDGSIFARAGIDRLYTDVNYFILDPKVFIPAPCQGILGIEIRDEDEYLTEIFDRNYDKFTNYRMEIERSFQKELSATCTSPIGIYTQINEGKLNLYGCYKADEQNYIKFDQISGEISEGILLSKKLANKLRSKYEK